MKMAFVASDPKTKHCYAICSADPDFIIDAADEIVQWKRDGAIIELLPAKEALDKFASDINCDSRLFDEHIG